MKFSQFFLLIALTSLFLASCSDDENECDTNCPSGQGQLLNCSCVELASSVDPHPCPDLVGTCAAGESLVINDNNTCECMVTTTDDGGDDDPMVGTVDVSGEITEDVTWTKDNIYILRDRVAVLDGVTLTIEPGTVIKGVTGTGSQASALVIARGATIMAEGTAEEPIIFTTILDNIEPGQAFGSNLDQLDNGNWGGLLILGRAPISAQVDGADVVEKQIEGIPANDINGLYGGNDPADNSGVLRYVSVRHGGAVIGANNEINGITFGGVGNGTVVENIEVVGNQDDGMEWFGGTVNATNVLVWAADDDGLDIDEAYSGTIDNAVVIAQGTDHGIEIDGPKGTAAGAFTLTNLTVKGDNQEMGQFRAGATGTLSNAYFFNFSTIVDGEGDLSFDDETTIETVSFENIEVTLPADASEITDVLKGGIDAFGTVVNEGANTVGANTDVFSWTYASQASALDF